MQLLTVQAGGDEDCAVCLSEMQQPCITLCAHVFCRACIEKVIRWVSLLPNHSIEAPLYTLVTSLGQHHMEVVRDLTIAYLKTRSCST